MHIIRLYKIVAKDIVDLIDSFKYYNDFSNFIDCINLYKYNNVNELEVLEEYGIYKALSDIYKYDMENFGKLVFDRIDDYLYIYDYLYKVILSNIFVESEMFNTFYDDCPNDTIRSLIKSEIIDKYLPEMKRNRPI